MTDQPGSAPAGNPGAEGAPAPSFDWKGAGVDPAILTEPSFTRIKDVPSLAKSYVEAQKLVGIDKIPIPKEGDESAWNDVYTKLGRPPSADGYNLKFADEIKAHPNFDPKNVDAFRPMFHKVGLSNSQTNALVNEFLKAELTSAAGKEEAAQKESDAAVAQLEKEQGANFPAFKDRATKGAVALGFKAGAELAELEQRMGTTAFLKHFAKIGELIGEHPLVQSGAAAGIGMSPATAQQKIVELNADAGHMAIIQDKTHPRYAAETERRASLYKAAYPEQQR